MNLRMIGLGAVVVFTVLLPLTATAGPEPAEGKGGDAAPVPSPSPSGLLSGIDVSAVTGGALSHTSTQCGPELASPEGVEAQTCVMSDARTTWARSYYRNATGGELAAVLSVMGPGGRTVTVNCAVESDDEPEICETPHERTAGKPVEYTAVAEFAGPGDGPLLLRSGSNSAAPAAG
ncbi:hypothetical protein [Streptomyces sp. NBC_01465]|uniref:hypothetical protein n=1 Tax=Streptomyces sp. NBC_01465 TaxID=2903878 RepID=UPI002E332E26|nr:hypothetical protein [Streptomyces sp. NBC_01465]